MNAVKIALLGTAALAAVSVSARADDLSDLKAQIEALNGRISQLESTPSIPAGFQLLTVSQSDAIIVPTIDDSKKFGKKATNIGILPTADVPASTNIQWSGVVKVALDYTKHSDVDNFVPAGSGQSLDNKGASVASKAGLKVVATTDTAVGLVGVRVALIGEKNWTYNGTNNGNGGVTTDGYWGWWQITPELMLAGGVDGSLGGNGQGFDGKEGIEAFGDGSGGYGHSLGGDPSQIRLAYSSGPIAFAIALEDSNNTTTKSAFGVAGEMKWSGDAYGFELNAGYYDNASTGVDENWTVNAGANVGLGDIAMLSLAAGVGEDGFLAGNADRYTKASAWVNFTLSDSISAQMGASFKNVKDLAKVRGDIASIGAGIYYSPVTQLKLGLEASYTKERKIDKDVGVAFVSVYSF
jgi:hypothetical protein